MRWVPNASEARRRGGGRYQFSHSAISARRDFRHIAMVTTSHRVTPLSSGLRKLAQFNQGFQGPALPSDFHSSHSRSCQLRSRAGRDAILAAVISTRGSFRSCVCAWVWSTRHRRRWCTIGFASLIVGDVSTSNENAENASAALQATIASLRQRAQRKTRSTPRRRRSLGAHPRRP